MAAPQMARAAPGDDGKGGPQIGERFDGLFDQHNDPSECLTRRTVSTSAAADILWLKRDCLCELAALVQSLGVSLAESAWRGSDRESEVVVRQLRAVLIDAIGIVKELSPTGDGRPL